MVGGLGSILKFGASGRWEEVGGVFRNTWVWQMTLRSTGCWDRTLMGCWEGIQHKLCLICHDKATKKGERPSLRRRLFETS